MARFEILGLFTVVERTICHSDLIDHLQQSAGGEQKFCLAFGQSLVVLVIIVIILSSLSVRVAIVVRIVLLVQQELQLSHTLLQNVRDVLGILSSL